MNYYDYNYHREYKIPQGMTPEQLAKIRADLFKDYGAVMVATKSPEIVHIAADLPGELVEFIERDLEFSELEGLALSAFDSLDVNRLAGEFGANLLNGWQQMA